MKNIVSIIISALLLFSSAQTYAQDSLFRFHKEIPYPVAYFATNLTGELYIINTNNQLIKFNSDGDSVGVFNDVKKYGKLSLVHAQNPWKTLLFYQNFQTIVLLDKYLKNSGSINLRDKNIFNVAAVATSYDNNIWLFDGREFKIKKIDDNGNMLMASVDFRQLFDEVPSPDWIADSDGLLYLYDPQKGVYIFDYYGAFKTMLPFTGWKSVSAIKKELIGFDNQNFYKYTPPLPVPSEKMLPGELQNTDQISISAKDVFVLKNNKLTVYRLFN